ncbi:hypothetical protein [Guyparkeria sp. TX1]|uniref:hypothetical protein n=1 Tax=Guyparkeria sp. TX1 TaxID=3115001 RepID=UPI003977259B
MRRWLRSLGPFALGCASGLAWYFFAKAGMPDETRINAILTASLTVGSILTAFLATSKAVIMSIRGARFMKQLTEAGYMADLVNILAQAVYGSFAFAVISMVGFFLPLGTIFWSIWVGLAVFSGLSFLRVVRVQFKLFMVAGSPRQQ